MLPIDAKDHDALIDALLPAVREAGRLEMAHFTKGVKFEQKADRSPVTVADHEAEAVLLAALAAIAPDIPVVAEERIAAGAACEYARQFFLVDALDGTRLFIRGKPEFSINIALVEDGKARFKPVTLGRDFGSELEVLSGLTGDEQIISNPSQRIVDGVAVQIVKAATTQKAS